MSVRGHGQELKWYVKVTMLLHRFTNLIKNNVKVTILLHRFTKLIKNINKITMLLFIVGCAFKRGGVGLM